MTGRQYELVDWLVGPRQEGVCRREAVRRAQQRRLRLRGSTAAMSRSCRARQRSDPARGVSGKRRREDIGRHRSHEPRRRRPEDLGFEVDARRLVLSRAKAALALGCDGVISSGLEAEACARPWARISWSSFPAPARSAEHRRPETTVDVEDAFRAGADYIVVGRPIRQAPDPHRAAQDIQDRIARLFAA